MTNPLRQALDETPADGSILSELLRGSLMAAESKFYPRREAVLDVNILGRDVEAYLSAQVSAAVVDSIAYFAKAAEDAAASNVKLTNSYRQKLGIRTLAAAGNVLKFGFTPPNDDPQTPLIDESQSPSLAELSTRNLALALPEESGDDKALDSALGLLSPERTGLYQLSTTLAKFGRDIRIQLAADHAESFEGMLTAEQAKVLETSMKESEDDLSEMIVQGRLDGMRTRRRQFFLETKSGRDIVGTVDEELLQELPRYIDRHVNANLQVRQPYSGNGRKGRPGYRLVSISEVVPPPML